MKRLILSFVHFFILSFATAFADHVEPLLDGWVRHQSAPFNRYCPTYIDNGKDTGQRCQVGCVATALETILSYHGRDIVLKKKLPAWSTGNFTTTDIPAGTRIPTSLILPDYGDGTAASVGMTEDDYEQSVDAVARLSLMCGMAAKMGWGLDSSGADAGDLVEPLHDIFGWKTAEYIDSYKYTPAQWKEILKNELRNGRPILYTGYTMNIGGHAFVIDGFDENDLFHVNWGYGGAYDGHYYDVTQLCPFAKADDTQTIDVQQGFFCNQQALILSPDDIDKTLLADSLKRTGKEIVVEKVTIDAPAIAGKYTPITFTLRNTSDKALCSPFEVFTNKTTESDIFRNGDYGALFGVNLAPGERTTVTAHCMFTKTGTRRLRISPDDVEVLYTGTINVTSGTADRLTFGAPSMEAQHSEGEGNNVDVTFSFPVTNNSTERSGSQITFGLMPDTEVVDGDWRHFDYYYIAGGETVTKSITYRNLVPGDTHLFIIRWPWAIQQRCVFTVPEMIAVDSNASFELDAAPAPAYDLFGRRVVRKEGGLLIHSGKKVLR